MQYVYDIETFPNIFSIGFRGKEGDLTRELTFEYSWRRNDMPALMQFLHGMKLNGDQMVGFNNLAFDYPVIHWIIENPHCTPLDIYLKALSIINTDWDDRFSHIIWDRDQHIPQIDLFKVHHFDSQAKLTSLKVLEFNMHRRRVVDLPFDPGTILDWKQCDTLISYMWDDIDSTDQFREYSKTHLDFRKKLTEKHDRSFMNDSDAKIGEQVIMMELEKHLPGFDRSNKTPRSKIHVGDILFSYIHFEQPEFQRIHQYFRNLTLIGTKAQLTDINCVINGFQFDFGTGGIHGSVESQIVESDADYVIEDWDVASYYPNLGIRNRLYPQHLGRVFCDIYEGIYEQRKTYKKGTPENAMLKLALNAAYGKSSSIYSCFYDPQYTMSITINGQLLLCMLAEQLMKGAELLQINTDGLTIRYDRKDKAWVHQVAKWWQDLTNLELESAEYKRMFIRDVNNYIGEYASGKIKRIGAYAYETAAENPGTRELEWHKNHSCRVVAKAAEAALVHGQDITEFIESHPDIMDFMLRTKVPRGSYLVGVDYKGKDHRFQNVSRYYISVMGHDLIKVMPPTPSQLNKNPDAPDRRIGINTGWKVTIANDMDTVDPNQIEFAYYISEAEKLVKPLRR